MFVIAPALEFLNPLAPKDCTRARFSLGNSVRLMLLHHWMSKSFKIQTEQKQVPRDFQALLGKPPPIFRTVSVEIIGLKKVKFCNIWLRKVDFG